MALLQCECGEQIQWSQQVGPLTCPGCGRRYTTPQLEEETTASAHTPVPSAEELMTPLSSTMVQDLPVVSQFQESLGHSIVSMNPSDVAIATPMVGLLAAGAVTPSGTSELETNSTNTAETRPLGKLSTELHAGLRLLDRYEILRKIGQGGMSTVYEALDEVRGERVALKVLLPNLARQPQLQERFLQEGRLASNFSHPNIARVYDLHQTDKMIFLSMELLQGSTLRHDMNRRKNQRQVYRPAEVLTMMQDVCAALEVVHADGVVHRDLKPENLWLDLAGSVKIMDFGIARDSTGTAYTTGGRGSGTPYYIAPEQLAASPTMDARADQYSVAIIMHELLTGELPQGAIVPPHEKNTDVPKKMSQAIFQALDCEPTKRFPTIPAFCAAAQFCLEKTWWEKLLVPLAVLLLLVTGGGAFVRWGAPLLQTEEVPVWEPLGPQQIVEGNELKFSVRSPLSTLDQQSLSFKLLADAPVGAKLDARTGEFVWTPTEAQGPNDYTFTVMAVVEAEGRAPVITERTLSISVAEEKHLPGFETPKPLEGKEHQAWEFPLVATDPNQPGIGLRYELLDPPTGMTINASSGVVAWQPGEQQGGKSFRVPVRVYLAGDENLPLFTERTLSVQIEESIDPPILTVPEQWNATVDEPVQLRAIARDPNTPAIDAYFALQNGSRVGMTIDPQTGVIFWTPNEEQAGKELDVTIQVRWDEAGHSQVLSEQALQFQVAELGEAADDNPDFTGEPASADEVGGGGGFDGGGFGGGGGGIIGGGGTGGNCKKGDCKPGDANDSEDGDSGGGNNGPSNGHPNTGITGGIDLSKRGGGKNTGITGGIDLSKRGKNTGITGGMDLNNRGNQGNGIRPVIDLVQMLRQKKKDQQNGPNNKNSNNRGNQQPVPQTRPFFPPHPGRLPGIRLQDLQPSNKKQTLNRQGPQLTRDFPSHNTGNKFPTLTKQNLTTKTNSLKKLPTKKLQTKQSWSANTKFPPTRQNHNSLQRNSNSLQRSSNSNNWQRNNSQNNNKVNQQRSPQNKSSQNRNKSKSKNGKDYQDGPNDNPDQSQKSNWQQLQQWSSKYQKR